jgi:hypothetical protein
MRHAIALRFARIGGCGFALGLAFLSGTLVSSSSLQTNQRGQYGASAIAG